MASYDLTISIVSYNTKALVRQCLQSIQEKTKGIKYQVIVVDNESRDGTPEMVEAEFPEVVLIRSGKNMGFSSANNIALEKAEGRYFVLFNSDASLKNDALTELVNFMDEHPRCGVSCPQLYYPDERLQVSHYKFRSPKGRALREVRPRIDEIKRVLYLKQNFKTKQKKRTVPEQPKRVQRPRGVCFMIRMECVKEIGPMDGNLFIFAEDVDWAWRAKKAGWERYIVPSAQVYHEDHASVSQRASMMQQIQMQSVYYFFYKHFGFGGWLSIRIGNLIGAVLALVLSALTFLLGDKRSRLSAQEHFTESKALLKLASLSKKVLPPDAV